MIDCAFDESGNKESPRGNLLVVSAYAGATSHMKKLSRSWQSRLDAAGISHFHTKELLSQHSKLFRGLSNRKRKALLTASIADIHRCVDWGFSAFIDPDYYISKTSPRFRSQWGSPYTFAMRLLILFFILHLERMKRSGEPVNILIEDGHVNAQQAIQMLKEFSAFPDRPLNIKTYRLGPKIGNPTLQAADILAYASCQNFCGPSPLMKRLISNIKPIHLYINCNTQVVDLMQDTVAQHFARRKAAWLEEKASRSIEHE